MPLRFQWDDAVSFSFADPDILHLVMILPAYSPPDVFVQPVDHCPLSHAGSCVILFREYRLVPQGLQCFVVQYVFSDATFADHFSLARVSGCVAY